MTEMVERARLAFADALMKTPAWEHAKKCEVGDVRQALRAAISAMREPTGDMKDAGATTYGVHNAHIGQLPPATIDGQPTKAWHAMIDAALGHQTKS